MARSTSEWAKRPTGRFILPAVVTVLLLGAAGTAGAYLVPQALESAPTPSVTPGFGQDAGVPATSASAAPLPSLSTGAGVITPPALPTGVPTATTPGAVTGARPADALAGWAQETGTRAGIPVVAVQAYGYAQLVAARRTPTCNLSWTTVAAIGKVESDHGSTGNSVLNTDGTVSPDIFGLQLNGEGGRQAIRDTDQGLLDKDTTWDRAVGPMQFIPQTWNELAVGNAVDADNDGISNPNDIDDAALATATYLCKGGRDMSKPDAWWEAILTYNAVRPYAQEVYRMANQYGQLSRG
ncbi:transglycosylase SLT domain-containing protein [Winogradskya consettensis]|nr:transglycosylase SLT domain-containing protein [Actinoplanes consettensis]